MPASVSSAVGLAGGFGGGAGFGGVRDSATGALGPGDAWPAPGRPPPLTMTAHHRDDLDQRVTTADSTQLQTDIQKLKTDAQAIHDQSQVTPAMEAKVRNDVKAIKGAETTTPDSTALTTLQTDLKTAQTNVGGPTAAQLAQVQTDQDAVYKSQSVNDSLVGQLDIDLAAIQTRRPTSTAANRSTTIADKAGDQGRTPPDHASTTSLLCALNTTATSATPPRSASTDSTATAGGIARTPAGCGDVAMPAVRSQARPTPTTTPMAVRPARSRM